MSISINSVTPLPSVSSQVQTTANSNNVTNLANATKTVVIDNTGAFGYINQPKAYGEIYVTNNTVATTITTAGTYYQFSSALWVPNPLNSQFTLNSTTGLQYTGATTSPFFIVFNMSAQTTINNQVCNFFVYKNGSPLQNCKSSNTLSNALPQNIVLSGLVSLAQNDILTLYLTNVTTNNAITLTEVSFEAFGV